MWRRKHKLIAAAIMLFLVATAVDAGAQPDNRTIDAESLFDMAMVNFKQKKFSETINLIDKALEQNPRSNKYLNQRAETYYMLEEYQLALNDANKVLSIAPDDIRAVHMTGRCYRMMSEPQSALKAYDRALKMDPKNPRTYFYLGNIYGSFKKYKTAEEYYLKAVQLEPSRPDYHFARADNLRFLKRWDEAIKEINTAINMRPNSAEFHNVKSVILYTMGRKKDALAALEKSLQLAPRNSKLICNLATLKQENGDVPGAIVLYKRALEQNPDNASALNNLGNICLHDGDFNAAKRYFDRAISANPKHLNALLNRAKLFARMGKAEQSLVDVEQARKVMAYNATMGKGADELRMPTKNEFRQIINSYARVLEMNPNDAASYYNRACTFFCLGDYRKAEQDFEKHLSLNKDPESRTSTFARIFSYFCKSLAGHESKVLNVYNPSKSSTWPAILIAYIAGKKSEPQLFKTARGTIDNTICHFVIGMNDLVNGKTAAGTKHLTWVVENGDRSMDEYMMAACELYRVQRRK